MLKKYWETRSVSEKKTFLIGMFFLILSLLFFVFYTLSGIQNNLYKQLLNRHHLLNWMKEADNTLKHALPLKQVILPDSFASIVQMNLNKFHLESAVQLEQKENNSMMLTFKEANFDALLLFLNQLWLDYPISVAQAKFFQTQKIGHVNGNLILKRSEENEPHIKN